MKEKEMLRAQLLIESERSNKLKAANEALQREISKRKRIEKALRESEARYRAVVEDQTELICRFSPGGILTFVNNAYCRFIGKKHQGLIGKNFIPFIPDEDRDKVLEHIISLSKENPVTTCEHRVMLPKGEVRWTQWTDRAIYNEQGDLVEFQSVGRDITELKLLEKEMARLDRLNLVGEMAAGIGHEIRNPMTTIGGFLQLLRDKKECTPYKEYFELVLDELCRVNSIINEFLSLAKNKVIELKMQNLNSIVKTLFPLIQADAMVGDKVVGLELTNTPDLLLDEKEIHQLILNLVRNGLEAMTSGGKLTIKTFTNGEKVVLSVADLGKGIKPEVLEKLGTPFFTTKENGTGLGLAVCYSIAARHNATIKVETGPEGTTFLVMF